MIPVYLTSPTRKNNEALWEIVVPLALTSYYEPLHKFFAITKILVLVNFINNDSENATRLSNWLNLFPQTFVKHAQFKKYTKNITPEFHINKMLFEVHLKGL